MNTLYLTQEEQMLFDGLSADLKEGWKVEEEELVFEDPDDLRMRCQMASFEDPLHAAIAKGVGKITSQEDIEKLAEGLDFSELSQPQMAELFFVLGTEMTTGFIRYILGRVESDEDVEGISGLTAIRRMLMESNA